MAKRSGIENNQEWQSSWVYRDARPFQVRVADKLSVPTTMMWIAGGLGFTGLAAPMLAVPSLVLGSCLFAWWELSGSSRKQLPLQMPKQAKLIDRSELNPVTRKNENGEGILYLGNNRSITGKKEECWVNNSQARTHFLIAGTTGSGKTMALLGMVANALTWGSGCIYVDGKADNSLFFNIHALCRRFGRDDHVYVLNFMTGGQDIFTLKKDGARRSNTFNSFSRGGADDFIQMMVSLMPPAGGDNAMWQGLAVGMIDAVIRGLCLRRADHGLEIDPGVIRDAIEMNSILEMAREFRMLEPGPPKYELVFRPIQTYLINLPGLDWQAHVNGGDPVEADTKKQHDFRSMQFLRQLTMIADTYGKVFRHQIPEVDMLDIILNNRVLVVMIPSMEKSEEESGAVGKLVVTALRMIMAMNLGDKVEGMYDDVVGSKATNSSSPYLCILDELGYFFTKGLAVIFAQARSLGFAMVAAMQDFPALMKGSNKEEAESVIANTKFKESLAMEDSQSTADFFLKTAGKAIVTEVSGYSGDVGATSTSYSDRMDASVNERDRVTLQELRDMETADSLMMWRDRIVRMRTFSPFLHINGAKNVKKFAVRLNRLVALHPPSVSGTRNDLNGFTEPMGEGHRNLQLLMEQFVAGVARPVFVSADPSVFDKPIMHLSSTFPHERTELPAKDGDLSLFIQLALLSEQKIVIEEQGTASSGSKGGPALLLNDAEEVVATQDEELDDVACTLLGLDYVAANRAQSEEDFLVAALAGDEIDAATYLDALPVEAIPAPAFKDALNFDELNFDLEAEISSAVNESAEVVVVKDSIKKALAMTDSILSAKPPGDADEASEILMEGVAFEPARPLAEPVNQDSAQQQIEDIMKSIMDMS